MKQFSRHALAKILFNRSLLATIAVALMISLGLMGHFSNGAKLVGGGTTQSAFAALTPDPQVLQKPTSTALVPTSVGSPRRLQIPKIKVDAAVDPMGLTPAGDMEAFSGERDVGWYKFGARPGAIGSAVISGHYGRWQNGAGSVFDNLFRLKKGDNLSVVDDQGVISNFVVRATRNYNPQADATAVFTSSDGKSHLNLVTCEGVWNPISKSYSQRLVLFADKV